MAANVVGEVQVRVVPDGSEFGPQLQSILSRATGQAGTANVGFGLDTGAVTAAVLQAQRSISSLGSILTEAGGVAGQFGGALAQAGTGVGLFGETFGAAGTSVGLLGDVLGQVSGGAQQLGAILAGASNGVGQLASIFELAAQASQGLDGTLSLTSKDGAETAATFARAAQQATELSAAFARSSADSIGLSKSLSQTAQDSVELGNVFSRTGADAGALAEPLGALGGDLTGLSGTISETGQTIGALGSSMASTGQQSAAFGAGVDGSSRSLSGLLSALGAGEQSVIGLDDVLARAGGVVGQFGGALAQAGTGVGQFGGVLAGAGTGVGLFGETFGAAGTSVGLLGDVLGQVSGGAQQLGAILAGASNGVGQLASIFELAAQASQGLDGTLSLTSKDGAETAATFARAAQQATELSAAFARSSADSIGLSKSLSQTAQDSVELGNVFSRTGADAGALGDLLGQTGSNASGLATATASAAQNMTSLGSQLTTVSQSANQASAAISQTSIDSQQLGQMVDQGIGSRFAQAAVSAAGFTGAVYAAKAVIEGTIGKLAGLFDQLAQAQAGFTAIAGKRQGDNLLSEIRQFAKDSPFVTQQLVNYSQQLLGVGLASEKIVPLLKDTGNVIASVGGDTNNLSRVLFTLTQIQTVGRLTGQDAMQLQSSLIPITKMLSSYLGKSTQEVKKMQEQGKISAESVFAAIQAAGQKVPDAMDNAVRNIAGARSVLSDTITIMMQDAPALNTIYQDIVKGIQMVAAKLGDPAVTAAAQKFFESIGNAYETIKPAISAFISTMGTTGLSSVKVFTTALGVLGTVLDAIPTPVLETIAKLLATVAMLRAPMMLMRYVNMFRDMSGVFAAGKAGGMLKGFAGLASGMSATDQQGKKMIGTTNAQIQAMRRLGVQVTMTTAEMRELIAAQEAEAAAQQAASGTGIRGVAGRQIGAIREKVSAIPGKAQAALGGIRQNMGGALAAGALMAGTMVTSNVDETNTAGQAIGGALSGAGMGYMIGGPVGAAAGAAIGAAVGWMQAAEAAAEAHARKMSELGSKAATDYLKANEVTFKSATGKSGEMLQQQMTELERIVNSRGKEWQSLLNAASATSQEEYDTKTKGIKVFSDDEMKQAEAKLAVFKSQYEDLFLSVEESFKGLPGLLPDDISKQLGDKIFTQELGRRGLQFTTTTLRSWKDLESVARYYGLTLEEVGNLGKEGFSKIIIAIEQLVDSEKQAILYANRYNAAAQEAAGNADAMFGGRKKMIDAQMGAHNAVTASIEASSKAYQNLSDQQAQMQAQSAQLAAQSAVYTDAYQTKIAQLGETVTAETAKTLANAYATQKAAEVIARTTVASISTIDQMAKQFKIPQQELLKILHLQEIIKPGMKIVVTAETADALNRLVAIAALMKSLSKVGMAGGDELKQLAQERYNLLKMLTDVGPPSVIAAAAPKGGGGGGKSAGQTFAEKVEQAGKSLEAAVKNAMQAAEQAASAWKASIKQRVQYEQAVSASRAMSNVKQQQKDISFLTTGISALKQRGLSEEALATLDINALTDVKQVKKLLAADPTELARLSAAIAERDRLASTLSFDRQQEQTRKTITQAIVEAAKLLGYTVTEEQANNISASFNIVSATDVKAVAAEILKQLSGGKVSY